MPKKIAILLQKIDNPTKVSRILIWDSQRESLEHVARTLGHRVLDLPIRDFSSDISFSAIERWLGMTTLGQKQSNQRRGTWGREPESEEEGFHHLPPDEYNREDTRENR